jgi:LuxR family transcriptional regulator, maltose regulon positive regulatory protein
MADLTPTVRGDTLVDLRTLAPASGAAEEDTRADHASSALTDIRDDPLLTTKLRVPPLPPQHVGRVYLTARLQQALERPLTLIAAPAGFGKTTLLSAWLHDAPASTAWVSLDSGDDDPTRFWSYTLAALDGVHVDGGLSAIGLPLLQSAQPPSLDVILTDVINRLAAFPADVVLVFDDYHVITAAPIHASVTFLLDHLPACLHLVIATRADPPLPLARLRARGQLVEIRSTDLRFTREEATAFLAQTSAPALSPEDIAALDARTEGWIAGLQLAALSLHGRRDIATFLQAFTGTHRFVVDYLTEEVLARQSADVQHFLLQTAILECLCGPLCEAVTSEPAGQPMLERLDQANLFVVPLDDERHWYRYHHLFAEVLRQRLQRLYPERIADLHQRASAWYAHHGMIRDAVHHALAAADFAQAARLIEQTADTMAKRGEIATLRTWLEALPADLIRARVELCLWHGWLLALDGQLDAAERLLQNLDRPPSADTTGAALTAPNGAGQSPQLDDARRLSERAGWVAAIRAFIAFRRGDAPRTIALARQALEQLPEEATVRSLVAWNLGIAYLWSGDLAAGAAALTEATVSGHTTGNSYAAFMATFELAQAQVRHGHLHGADRSYRQALDMVAERGGHLAATGPLYMGRGDLQREWNNLDAAAVDLHEGIARCQQTGNRAILLLGYVALARVRQAQGDAEGAYPLIQTIEQSLHTHRFPPHNAAPLAAWHARLSLQQGDLAAAWRWAQSRHLHVDDAPDPPREVEYLTWARVLLTQHRAAEAEAVLGRLLRLAERQGRMGSVLEILVLQALAQQAGGDEAGAIERLARALSLAEPEGYIRLFVDEGAPMTRLLVQMRARRPGEHDGSLRYCDRLLALLGRAPDTFAPPAATAVPRPGVQPLDESLRDRELEVLRLIIAGCSNREIAERLVIAVSTVKWYVNTIYSKLQVDSRTKAIARARELDIV